MTNQMTTTKLAINLIEGTVQAEGSEDFVRFIYQDFKDSLSKHVLVRTLPARPLEQDLPSPALLTDESKGAKESKERKKRAPRKAANPKNGDKPSMAEYKPSFRSDLDLKDLEAAYDAFDPGNHNEKILVFAVFLRERFQIAPCTADDIYTCYRTMKDKTETPQAFLQAFRTAENRTHFIEFVSQEQIRVTIAGDNYYNKKLQGKKEARK